MPVSKVPVIRMPVTKMPYMRMSVTKMPVIRMPVIQSSVDQKPDIQLDFKPIGLHHPLDGVTYPEYKLLHFIQLTNFLQREEGTSF